MPFPSLMFLIRLLIVIDSIMTYCYDFSVSLKVIFNISVGFIWCVSKYLFRDFILTIFFNISQI